jgi:hypothetical protein
LVVDVAADRVHSAQSATKADSPHAAADTLAEPINQNGPEDVASELEEDIKNEHTIMVALISRCEKTGKAGYSARMARQPNFPVFAKELFCSTLNRP